jgi:hypothetical protein
MRFGRLAHSLYLGAQAGEAVPVVFDGERRGNKWKEFCEQNKDKDIVTASEFERVAEMASQLHLHKEAVSLLMGQRERTILFESAGRPCRATPDVVSADHLVEIKTTTDASPGRFPYTAMRLAYHAQLAFYLNAVGSVRSGFGVPKTVAIVAIEVKPPFAVAVYRLSDRAIDFGERLWRGWFEEFRVCEESGIWPGYPAALTLDAPETLELVGADGEVMEVE